MQRHPRDRDSFTDRAARGTRSALAAGIALVLLASACSDSGGTGSDSTPPPNILFITMDDVGVDQLTSFGYGGATPASTSSLDAIGAAGVRFRNTWSTPECSPSRAMFFEGRYPFRTGVVNAFNNQDLANSQLSPYEFTTPKLLASRGYESGFFGKLHLSGPTYNPYGNGTPRMLGFDYFYGFVEGSPYPIDTTAGGAGAEDAYPCGFVPDASQPGGADEGACYLGAAGPCTELGPDASGLPAGLRCLQSGGILDPGATCAERAPEHLTFDEPNAYYVSPLVINQEDGTVVEVPYADPRARRYRTELETDAAIAWINSRTPGKPWMASLSFSAIHTPYQQPPMRLLPDGTPANGGLDCIDGANQRVLGNQMIEAMDREIGRVLVETGLATRNADGSLSYDPAKSNTWIAVVSDNGSYLTIVKAPFNPERAKGTIYQTGVWVPFIVAGPGVAAPGRDVGSMVNVADLYALFAEIAGVDLKSAVPSWRPVDAAPVMPYLRDPDHGSVRSTNFTYTGSPVKAPDVPASPCVIPAGGVDLCTLALPGKGICDAQNGVWYGADADVDTSKCGPDGCADCCAVKNNYLPDLEILADIASSVRNDHYKLIENQTPDCANGGELVTSYEFYRIDEDTPVPLLDNEDDDLLTSPTLPPQGLDAEQERVFEALYAELQSILSSEPDCPGDGNLDRLVDQQDLDEWQLYAEDLGGGGSSWYDFNHDGLTNDLDRQVIEDNFGLDCRTSG
ncbi:sulfatase-like hydrolase/transferase [Candidatus Binatia bacterium]|nr:sulfatase-like hydrolase/transferase [Candidatus Binatia bacterium]